MKRVFITLAIMAALATQSINAADTEVHGQVFGYWMLDKTNGSNNLNEFGLDRSYFTAKSKLSDYTSGRITIDLRETVDADGNTRYDMILKYGYFDWTPKFTDGRGTVRFGLQPTMYIDMQNGLWGRRYVEKTPSDLYKALTSSDLGASIAVNLGEEGEVATIIGAVYNGTSYSDLGEANKHKDFNVVAAVTPLTKNEEFKRTTIIAQYYHGTQNENIPADSSASDFKRNLASIGGLLGYRDIFDAGADLNFLTMGDGFGNPDIKSNALTFHGTLYLGGLLEDTPALRTLDLFGRFDLVDPDTDLDNNGFTHMILGVECAPVKGVKASVNYRSTSYDAPNTDTEKSVNVNTLFKF